MTTTAIDESPAVSATEAVPVRRYGVLASGETDLVAVEAPLEMRLLFEDEEGSRMRRVGITMRTPGHDDELALGFLYGEGILEDAGDVLDVSHCGPAGGARNVVTVRLRPGLRFDGARLDRHFYTTSSCGVCGKTTLEALAPPPGPALPEGRPRLSPSILSGLPRTLRASQQVFEATGGLHAAALFSPAGALLAVREDVGRHNAFDKLVGLALREGWLPLSEGIVLLSGRASYELIQKALRAGIPFVAAVGAPSSLAVAMAAAGGLTLAGFVRDDRFNVYCGATRLD